VLAVLVGFGALGIVVALGHDLRVKAERLRSSSAYLLALNAIVVAAVGAYGLADIAGEDVAKAWIAGVALVHIAVGLAGPRLLGITNDVRLLALGIGAVLGNIAFGLIVDGPMLTIGWAAAGVGFAVLVRRGDRRTPADPSEAVLAHLGLGGHLALSMLAALVASDPGEVLTGASLSVEGGTALAALASACLVSARIAGERSEVWRIALDTTGLVVVALLTALTLDGVVLVLAWTAEVVALAAISRRTGDELAKVGSLAFLGLAAMHALMFEAPPLSLVTGLADPLAGAAALGAVGGSILLLARWVAPDERQAAAVLQGAAALTLLYMASALVVTPFESDAAVDSVLLSAHQQGQMVLSVFWGLVGVGTIVVGLRRDIAVVRTAGLLLLGVTVGKLFLFDLATLTSVYRVVSFIGLGLLLLAGALVWQRLRPVTLGDLREAPRGVR
jgi:hypothetical protein